MNQSSPRPRQPIDHRTPDRAQGAFATRRDLMRWLGVAVLGPGAWSCIGVEETLEPPAPDSGAVAEPFMRNGVRAAPGLPAPRLVETNGITLGVYDSGGGGVPVVFNHGFPELAYSWRHQIPALAEAGYRAIAPDQRGYGISDRPEAVSSYRLTELCADMAGMLDALGIDKAVFCGHDWGGGVVWMMPRLHPDRVLGVVGLNTPTGHPGHPRQPNPDPLIIRSENYYTLTFQEPGRAEAVLERDVRTSFEFFMRRGGLWDEESFRALPEDSPERQLDLLRMIEEGNPSGEVFLTEAELDYFTDTFEATGFTGGLNWYRAAATAGPDSMPPDVRWDIEVPCLYIGAENDVVLPPSSADGMEDFIGDLEKHTVADCGHWTQQEKPGEVNRVVLDWLGRKIASA